MNRAILLAFGSLLLISSLAAAETPPPDDAKGLIGCWQNTKDNSYYIRFTPTKCMWTDKGRIQFARARYSPGSVVISMTAGTRVNWSVELKDNVLTLKSGEKPSVWNKLEGVPKELDVKPLELGNLKPLPLEKIKAVQAELKAREQKDQSVRTDPTKRDEMSKVDADNTAYLTGVLREVGWIDVARFGEPASQAAFLLVQHSGDVPLMLAALPPLEKDVRAKRIDGQPYALLYDRLQLYMADKQRYGTQVGTNKNGEMVVLPLEDKAKVEQYRKELGMFPLAEYLALFKAQNGGKDVKFMEEEAGDK